MKARLLSTVAASLLLAVGVASAQTINEQAPARAPAAQQSAPAEKVAPPMNAGERKAPETTGQASPKPGAQDFKDGKGTPSSTPGHTPGAADSGATGSDAKGSDTKTMNKSDNKTDATKSSQDGARGASSTTTGQGAAAGAAKLSTEQQTKISTVIKSQKVERVEPSRLNISVNVGTRVPSTVRFHRLPVEVITIYPQWRGYDYILVGDQIVILDPRSHEIVFIIAA
jgi:hypothetical protein